MNKSKQIYHCPSCGHRVTQLTEGYCFECFTERQNALYLHNAEYEIWNSLTNAEKEARIKWSLR